MASTQELAGRMRSRARGLVKALGYDVHKVREEPLAPAAPERPKTVPPTAMLDLCSDNAQVSEDVDTVDTCGYEIEVLRGATSTLPLVAALHAELSPTALYDGQILQIDGGFTRLGEVKKPA